MRNKQINKVNRMKSQYLLPNPKKHSTRIQDFFNAFVSLLNFLERKGELQMNRFGNWVYQMSNEFFNPEEKLMIEESKRLKAQLNNNRRKLLKNQSMYYSLSMKFLNKKIQELIIKWKSIIGITLYMRVKLIELFHRISIAHF